MCVCVCACASDDDAPWQRSSRRSPISGVDARRFARVCACMTWARGPVCMGAWLHGNRRAARAQSSERGSDDGANASTRSLRVRDTPSPSPQRLHSHASRLADTRDPHSHAVNSHRTRRGSGARQTDDVDAVHHRRRHNAAAGVAAVLTGRRRDRRHAPRAAHPGVDRDDRRVWDLDVHVPARRAARVDDVRARSRRRWRRVPAATPARVLCACVRVCVMSAWLCASWAARRRPLAAAAAAGPPI